LCLQVRRLWRDPCPGRRHRGAARTNTFVHRAQLREVFRERAVNCFVLTSLFRLPVGEKLPLTKALLTLPRSCCSRRWTPCARAAPRSAAAQARWATSPDFKYVLTLRSFAPRPRFLHAEGCLTGGEHQRGACARRVHRGDVSRGFVCNWETRGLMVALAILAV
jgi:hypothetical protein